MDGSGKLYEEDVNVYLKDDSEEDLKSILGDFRIKVTWHSIWSPAQDTKIFYLKDYLS